MPFSRRSSLLPHVLTLQLHLCQRGLESHPSFGNLLSSLLAKSGKIGYAVQTFEKLQRRDGDSWSDLIAAYVAAGEPSCALSLYRRKNEQAETSKLSWYALAALLKACSTCKDLIEGGNLCAEISKSEESMGNACIGSALVGMYAKCGDLVKAREIFENLPVHDVVLWTAMVGGYVEHGHDEDALMCMKEMLCQGIAPNDFTFVYFVKACQGLKDAYEGRRMHGYIVCMGYESDPLVGNVMIVFYGKCGCLLEGENVFETLESQTVISWTALISGYVEAEDGCEALKCFRRMKFHQISPDASALVCCLKSSILLGSIEKGRDLHNEIVMSGFDLNNHLVTSTLIDMYAKCGFLSEAQTMFDRNAGRDVVSWTILISGYVVQGFCEEALKCLERMENDSLSSNAVTFACIFQACSSIRSLAKSREMHINVTKKGMEKEPISGSALTFMYCKLGQIEDAQDVAEKFPVHEVVVRTALVDGYVEHGFAKEALQNFQQLQHEGLSLKIATLVCGLKACASLGTIVEGQQIHMELVSKGLEQEPMAGNTLVDMYAKLGLLDASAALFNKLLIQDVISWNAVIGGYLKHGRDELVIDYFERMQGKGKYQDEVTYVHCLKACGNTGTSTKGMQVHCDLIKRGLESRSVVGNTLIDMYTKYGLVSEVLVFFEGLVNQADEVSWNALIALYAQLGDCGNAFRTCERMIGKGVRPTAVSFISLLNACSHAGCVKKGLMLFALIIREYDHLLSIEHYACVVDLLGRAGLIDKAVAMTRKMPVHPDAVVWYTILAASRKWHNVELGRYAFEQAIGFDEFNPWACILMYQIYTSSDMPEEASKVEAMRRIVFLD